MSDARPTPARPDVERRVFVTLALAFCLVATLAGLGIAGTAVRDASRGAFSAHATLLSLGEQAFWVWRPIFVGMVVYTVMQWLPSRADSEHYRDTGWWAGAVMIQSGAWLVASQSGWLWVSVFVMFALVWTVGTLLVRLTDLPPLGWIDSVVLDGTFGLMLGFAVASTIGNVAATLQAEGVRVASPLDELIAVAVLGLGAMISLRIARFHGGRWAVALALAWGFFWIAWPRTFAEPNSPIVAGAALLVATVALATTLAARLQRRHSPR